MLQHMQFGELILQSGKSLQRKTVQLEDLIKKALHFKSSMNGEVENVTEMLTLLRVSQINWRKGSLQSSHRPTGLNLMFSSVNWSQNSSGYSSLMLDVRHD